MTLASTFISTVECIKPWPEFAEIAQCEFDINAYNDGLFAEHEFDFPNALARAVPKRKSEYLAGRICASKLMHQRNMAGPINTGPNREPVFPSPHIVGTITHTNLADNRNLAMAAIADAKDFYGIGLDVEGFINTETYANIKDKIINPTEETLIERLEIPNNQAFTIIFSVKESFYKAGFALVKRFFGFSAIEITQIDIAKQLIHFRIIETLNPIINSRDNHQARFLMTDNCVLTAAAIAR